MNKVEMKLVPMAGLKINYYKDHIIEWVEALGKYRVCQRKYPEQACCYVDSIREGQEKIDEMT